MADRVTIAPFQSADLDGVVDLLIREMTADPMTSEMFQRKVLLDPNFDIQGAPVAKADGKVVGFMLGIVRKHLMEEQAADFDKGWISLIAVDKDYQRQGIGTGLWAQVKAYFQARGATAALISTYAPNYFVPGVDLAAYPGAVEFFKSQGFQVPVTVLSMDSPLVNLETPEWIKEKEAKLISEGITFDTFQPKYILPLLEHLKTIFPGDWQRYLRESMVRITLGEFDRGQVYIAMHGDKCLGFCQHDGERFGPFGTDDKERGRGIGAVLLLKCLMDMKRNGFHNAWFLSTTDDAARVYKEGGFRESRRFAVLKTSL